MKKLIDVNKDLWERFEKVAVAKFGLYGAITKGITEAIREWVGRGERESDE